MGAHAADAPFNPADASAQELLRQQERERLLRQQQEQTPDVRLQTPQAPGVSTRLPDNESPCFPIRQIELKGDSAERFTWAIAAADQRDDKAVGRCLGTAGVNLVMKRVQNAIVEKGFVTTRIVAEEQDLRTGVLRLTVIPGRIRAIRFAEGTAHRATQWNAVPAQPGDILNLRDIEQALENFKRVPTAEADIQITPAEGATAKPGESDLVIVWKQALPFRISVSADDSGSEATGKYQGSVTFSYDDWWTLNDLFYLTVSRDLVGLDHSDKGTRGYSAFYSVPFGYWLLSLSANSSNYYQSVAGATQTYIYRGESQSGDIKLSRLVYRDAVRKTTLSMRGWTRASKNFINDTEVEVQRRRTAGWEFGIAHREFVAASTVDLNVTYKRGTGAFGTLAAPEEAFGEGTSRAGIINANLQLNVPWTAGSQRLRYSGEWRAQWNRTPLVPQDRFSIGGRYTVRGFDGESSLSAERGWLVRNELNFALGDSAQEFYLGADYGEVAGPSAQNLVGYRLAGVVMGLHGGFKGVNYDVFVGRPILKPELFQTATPIAGFNVGWSY
ncbi:ShlB/FhaC/HecB family hemolysin secretion/activation protein [Andreprevotia chitinilytica]|uniref:ShlB/FhaC/HecB family hemolysin secretion/activation protein n=1 Tax=Andreprevotia chitinilytica TaxID=396808 RepID=UPI00054FFFF7|nr:ShlB/FhaC/HecB family hemolysin secretion/activation protein [Andreprevotia chitinilytica]